MFIGFLATIDNSIDLNNDVDVCILFDRTIEYKFYIIRTVKPISPSLVLLCVFFFFFYH